MSNPDYKTILIPLEPLEVSFTPEDFANVNGGDNIYDYQDNKYLTRSAIDIINNMSYKEIGEQIKYNVDLNQVRLIEGYNDNVEGDIKEIVDGETKSNLIKNIFHEPTIDNRDMESTEVNGIEINVWDVLENLIENNVIDGSKCNQLISKLKDLHDEIEYIQEEQ